MWEFKFEAIGTKEIKSLHTTMAIINTDLSS